MANAHNDHDDELKASEDQIKKLKEENRNHELEELIEQKIKEETGSFKEQIKDYGESLEKKMKLYLGIALGAVAIAAFFLNYLGSEQITRQVNEKISKDANDKLDLLIRKVNHNADSIVSARADSLVSIIVSTKADSLISMLVNEKGDKVLKEVRSEMEERFKLLMDTTAIKLNEYLNSIAKLSINKLNPERPIPKEVKKDLNKANELRAKSDIKEPDYSFNDWYIKGVAEYDKNEMKEALYSFSKALDKDPASADAYRYRGSIYSELNQCDKAIDDYNKAFGLKPGTAFSYYNRGLCYFKLTEYSKAIADYDVAIRFKSDYAKAYNNRGLAYYESKDFEKAIKDYNKAIKYDSRYAAAFNNRGVAYEATGKRDKAKSDFKRAKELDPQKYK